MVGQEGLKYKQHPLFQDLDTALVPFRSLGLESITVRVSSRKQFDLLHHHHHHLGPSSPIEHRRMLERKLHAKYARAHQCASKM